MRVDKVGQVDAPVGMACGGSVGGLLSDADGFAQNRAVLGELVLCLPRVAQVVEHTRFARVTIREQVDRTSPQVDSFIQIGWHSGQVVAGA